VAQHDEAREVDLVAGIFSRNFICAGVKIARWASSYCNTHDVALEHGTRKRTRTSRALVSLASASILKSG
jgi:hypothetical protein